MKSDPIKDYLASREKLWSEKAKLQARLAQIEKALSVEGSGPEPAVKHRRSASRQRIQNPISLRKAIQEVTKNKALSKTEILAAVKKLGYRFASSKPVNSLNAILYSKKQFKNQGGKFSPA